jgi:asparagine synthase (glutamine-hydrolysing)
MLASVEGRTPFADIRVARFAESLAMADKFVAGEPARTKIALRDAFRGRLPKSAVARPKASFPLPFQGWLGPMAEGIGRSDFARAVFTPEAIERVRADPAASWTLAWPMVNIAAWGERWWGSPPIAEHTETRAAAV